MSFVMFGSDCLISLNTLISAMMSIPRKILLDQGRQTAKVVGGAMVRALALELAGHGFDPNWWHAAELVLIVSTTLSVV